MSNFCKHCHFNFIATTNAHCPCRMIATTTLIWHCNFITTATLFFGTATSLQLQHSSLALQLNCHCNTSWKYKHIVTTTSLPLQLPTFTGCVWLRCRSNFIAHCYFKQTHICRKLFTKENKPLHAAVQVDPKSDDLYVTHAIQWGKEHGDTLYLSKAATTTSTTSTKYTTTSTTTFPSCAAPPRLIGQNFKA